MRRFSSYGLMGLTVALALNACGSKPSGPDQTLVLPTSDWKITDHEPGDKGQARWIIESKDTSVELYIISPAIATKDDVSRVENFRTYLLSSAQNIPVLSRYWSDGDIKFNRQYTPLDLADIEHGSVSIMAETSMKAFLFIFTNHKTKKDELCDFAEKSAAAFVKANVK